VDLLGGTGPRRNAPEEEVLESEREAGRRRAEAMCGRSLRGLYRRARQWEHGFGSAAGVGRLPRSARPDLGRRAWQEDADGPLGPTRSGLVAGARFELSRCARDMG
jgi:hypothetical protein